MMVELFSDTANYMPEQLRLIAVALVEMHPKGEVFLEERFSPVFAAIRQYIELNIKVGKIRDLDPTTVIAALTMATLTRAEFSRLIDKNRPLCNHQEKNRSQARFWLDLLAPGISSQALPPVANGEEHPC